MISFKEVQAIAKSTLKRKIFKRVQCVENHKVDKKHGAGEERNTVILVLPSL